jgi:hypothetical protein
LTQFLGGFMNFFSFGFGGGFSLLGFWANWRAISAPWAKLLKILAVFGGQITDPLFGQLPADLIPVNQYAIVAFKASENNRFDTVKTGLSTYPSNKH